MFQFGKMASTAMVVAAVGVFAWAPAAVNETVGASPWASSNSPSPSRSHVEVSMEPAAVPASVTLAPSLAA